MKGSGACDNRPAVSINSKSATVDKLSFKSVSQTDIVKDNQTLIEFRYKHILTKGYKRWSFCLYKQAFKTCYPDITEKLFEKILIYSTNWSKHEYATKQEAQNALQKIFSDHNIKIEGTKTYIHNDYVCKQNEAFSIRKDSTQSYNNKLSWRVKLIADYMLSKENKILWKDSKLEKVKFSTRKEAADALEFFLNSCNLI